jgi:hypothetical protein
MPSDRTFGRRAIPPNKVRQRLSSDFRVYMRMRCSLFPPLLLVITATNPGPLAQSEGTFAPTGNMTTPRVLHSDTLLHDGRVLIAGGHSSALGPILASTELYDPSTGTFTSAGSMTTPKFRHTATLLANGKVPIGGGDGVNGTAELYDPETGQFTRTGDMVPNGSAYYTATALSDGKVLFVADGFDGSGAELYDPSSGVFAATGNPLAAPYGPNTATALPDGKVLITHSSELLAEVYDPGTDAFRRTAQIYPPVGAAAPLLDGNVLFAGGNLGYSEALVYVTKTATTSRTGDLTQGRIDHTATLLPDGRVLIAGGQVSGGTLSCSELYDPQHGVFTPTGKMTSDRGSHTATLLSNGKVLIAGGTDGEVQTDGVPYRNTAELYTPDSLIGSPALFSLSGDGKGAGAIWHSTMGAVVSAGNPAIAGEALSMYTSNLAKDAALPPQVISGDRFAEVLYFGLAPGYPDYFQLNFLMPSGAHGSAVPVRLMYLDRSSMKSPSMFSEEAP